MKQTLGAQLFTVRAFTQTLPDIAKTLQKISAIGYTAIQISGFGPVDPQEVARLVVENGLRVAATHLPWQKFLKQLDEVIAIHKQWDCYHAAIGGLPEEYYTLDGLKRFLDELTPIAEKLAAEGIDFSYHNHNHELRRFEQKTWLELLYERAEPRLLKAEIDVYWIQASGGDPAEWIRRCSGREPLLHLKDMSIGPDKDQRMAEIGEGNLNWPAILQAANQAEVEWLLVEQDECYCRDPFESLAISYRYLSGVGLL